MWLRTRSSNSQRGCRLQAPIPGSRKRLQAGMVLRSHNRPENSTNYTTLAVWLAGPITQRHVIGLQNPAWNKTLLSLQLTHVLNTCSTPITGRYKESKNPALKDFTI